MKKLLIFPLLAAVVFTACKKKDNSSSAYTCAACAKTPTALAANDASTKGVYKGVIIGSSGTISFDVMNGGSGITARMVIDGTTVDLTSSITWTDGQPYVAPFTGTLNGSPVSITFSIGLSGASPTVIASNIPGHPNATFTVVKETSTSLVEAYEGTYHTSKPEDGTFNIILARTAKIWGGKARENGDSTYSSVGGTISSDNKLIDDNNKTIGTLAGDEINGTFTDNNNTTVTVKGKRTL